MYRHIVKTKSPIRRPYVRSPHMVLIGGVRHVTMVANLDALKCNTLNQPVRQGSYNSGERSTQTNYRSEEGNSEISAHKRCFQMKNPLIISLYFSINPAQPTQCKSTPVRASGPYWHIEIAAWIIRNKEETQINTSALVGPYPCLLLVLSCSCCSCTSAYFSHFKHMLLCPMVEVISSLESHQFPWWT